MRVMHRYEDGKVAVRWKDVRRKCPFCGKRRRGFEGGRLWVRHIGSHPAVIFGRIKVPQGLD